MGTPVPQETQQRSNPLADYLVEHRSLISDQRTAVTLGEVMQDIIGAGSSICERIAARSAVLASACPWCAALLAATLARAAANKDQMTKPQAMKNMPGTSSDRRSSVPVTSVVSF